MTHRNRKPNGARIVGCSDCDGQGWVWLRGTAPDGTVRVVEASCPTCCGPPTERVLDWRAAHHWSPRRRRCRHCGGWTNLLDDTGAPAHKICAEHAAARAVSDETPARGPGVV